MARQKNRMENLFGAPGANSPYAQKGAPPAGFVAGLWHGFIAPISTFAAMGNPLVQPFEARNRNRWYGIGYRIGAADPFALD